VISCFVRVFKEWIKLISQGITVPAICNTIIVQWQWVRVHEQKQHNFQAMFLLLQWGTVQTFNLYVASVKQVCCGETDFICLLQKVVQCWPFVLALLNPHILCHVLKVTGLKITWNTLKPGVNPYTGLLCHLTHVTGHFVPVFQFSVSLAPCSLVRCIAVNIYVYWTRCRKWFPLACRYLSHLTNTVLIACSSSAGEIDATFWVFGRVLYILSVNMPHK
jgi:hypothetical protein